MVCESSNINEALLFLLQGFEVFREAYQAHWQERLDAWPNTDVPGAVAWIAKQHDALESMGGKLSEIQEILKGESPFMRFARQAEEEGGVSKGDLEKFLIGVVVRSVTTYPQLTTLLENTTLAGQGKEAAVISHNVMEEVADGDNAHPVQLERFVQAFCDAMGIDGPITISITKAAQDIYDIEQKSPEDLQKIGIFKPFDEIKGDPAELLQALNLHGIQGIKTEEEAARALEIRHMMPEEVWQYKDAIEAETSNEIATALETCIKEATSTENSFVTASHILAKAFGGLVPDEALPSFIQWTASHIDPSTAQSAGRASTEDSTVEMEHAAETLVAVQGTKLISQILGRGDESFPQNITNIARAMLGKGGVVDGILGTHAGFPQKMAEAFDVVIDVLKARHALLEASVPEQVNGQANDFVEAKAIDEVKFMTALQFNALRQNGVKLCAVSPDMAQTIADKLEEHVAPEDQGKLEHLTEIARDDAHGIKFTAKLERAV